MKHVLEFVNSAGEQRPTGPSDTQNLPMSQGCKVHSRPKTAPVLQIQPSAGLYREGWWIWKDWRGC